MSQNLAPQYLADKLQYTSDVHQCNTRQAAVGNLALPPLRNGHDICFFDPVLNTESLKKSELKYKIQITQKLHN